MKNTCLLIFFFINLMLSACSKDGTSDCTPPFLYMYSINVRLTDLTGNDLTKELPLEFLSESAGIKKYAIKEGSFHFYFDGKEMVPQQGVEPGMSIERYVYEPPASSASPFIDLTFASSFFIEIDEFRPGLQPTHTFEYRFTLPSMFGEEEQVISIQCEARNFHAKEPKKVFINGVESESNDTNSFILIVDKN